MKHLAHIHKLQEEWKYKFESIVRNGASFPSLISVEYPFGINPIGLSKTTEGRSWFFAKVIKANPNYQLEIGEDIVVAYGDVEFIDSEGNSHVLEPDLTDLYWVAEVLDNAEINETKTTPNST